jgi:diphthine-ammonia ligase
MLLAPASFPTHAILALQHLFRIGADMHVRWWTSAVAYLPRSPPSHLPLLAALAGRAWTLAHLRADEDEDPAPDRDLWEEKHGMGPQRSRHVLKTALPDWECVHGDLSAPPFFAVEVQELPRGSGVEWHAHVGVAGGTGVEVSKEEREGGVVYRCAVVGRVYLVVMVLYAEVGRRLEEVLAKEGAAGREYVTYWDVSLGPRGGELLGMIPCRSIWDAGGRRLGAVLLYDIPST